MSLQQSARALRQHVVVVWIHEMLCCQGYDISKQLWSSYLHGAPVPATHPPGAALWRFDQQDVDEVSDALTQLGWVVYVAFPYMELSSVASSRPQRAEFLVGRSFRDENALVKMDLSNSIRIWLLRFFVDYNDSQRAHMEHLRQKAFALLAPANGGHP